MKKNILTLILIFIFLQIWNIFVVNWNFDNDIKYTNELLEIPNGDKYKLRIDYIIEKYWEDKLVLEELNNKLYIINEQYENKIQIKKIIYVLKIINYFKFQVEYKLYFLEKNNIWEEKDEKPLDLSEEKEDLDTKLSYEKKDLYEGFLSNYNDKSKTVLAGEEDFVYNASIVASIEEIDVEELEYILESSDMSNFKYWIKEASLYVEWNKLRTVSSSSIEIISATRAKIKFDKINWFIVPKQEIEFRLSVIPQTIWYEKIAKFNPVITVKEVKITKVEWLISGNNITPNSLSEWEEKFQISPAKLRVSLVKSFNESSYWEINIQSDFGQNTKESNNSELKVELQKLIFSYQDNSNLSEFKLINVDDSSDFVLWIINNWLLEFDLTSINKNIISQGNWENYKIYVNSNVQTTVSLELLREWIIYNVDWIDNSVNINAYLQDYVDLWVKSIK